MILGVASGKGGIGKSFLATNLAYMWSQQNKKVLLFDADAGVCNDSYFFDISFDNSVYHFLYEKMEWENLKLKINDNLDLISMGRETKNIVDISENVQNKIIQNILKEKENYDAIIIDSSPGIHKNLINFLTICDKIIIMISNETPALMNGYALLKVLKEEYKMVSQIYIVINMESKKELALQSFDNFYAICAKFLKCQPIFLTNINNSDYVKRCTKDRKIFMEHHKDHSVEKQILKIGDMLYG